MTLEGRIEAALAEFARRLDAIEKRLGAGRSPLTPEGERLRATTRRNAAPDARWVQDRAADGAKMGSFTAVSGPTAGEREAVTDTMVRAAHLAWSEGRTFDENLRAAIEAALEVRP